MLNSRRGVGFHSREAIENYTAAANKSLGEFLFGNRRRRNRPMTTPYYAGMVFGRIAGIGLDQRNFEKHSLHRTKAALIYRRTGNLHAVQLLLGQILALTRTNDKRGCGSSAWAPLYCRLCRYRLLFAPDVLHARTVEDAVDHKGQPVPAGASRFHRGWRSRRHTVSVGSCTLEGGRIDVR